MTANLPTLMASTWVCGSGRKNSKSGCNVATAYKSPPEDSESEFAEKNQTAVIFDWDDTLFPSAFLLDTLKANWKLPLSSQPWEQSHIDQALGDMSMCEMQALEALRGACKRGHVVIVTLAKPGWVGHTCKLYFKKMGIFIQRHKIPVIYAQDSLTTAEQTTIKLSHGSDHLKLTLKACAIRDELQKFYSQYPGQTWKNVLSVGDALFEHYGLLAASHAYMDGQATDLSRALTDLESRASNENSVWEKVSDDDQLVRLRIKCCKFVESPSPHELFLQLQTMHDWFNLMVDLDDGFYLDFEYIYITKNTLSIAEGVLRGDYPASALHDLGRLGSLCGDHEDLKQFACVHADV